jgi:phage terminase small subunit
VVFFLLCLKKGGRVMAKTTTKTTAKAAEKPAKAAVKVARQETDNLTERQKRFAEYYIQTLNATEAAKKAGYSEKTAYSVGAENLKKPEILEYINSVMKKLQSERIADADEVMQFLTEVMRGKVEDQDGKITSVYDRTRAAELLGKRYRMFIDKQEVETVEKVTIVNDIPNPDAD